MENRFDIVMDRSNTNCVKWDFNERNFGDKDVLSMWIADMDFKVPDEIIEDIKKRAEHGIFGYTAAAEDYYNATIEWMKTHHNFNIKPEWICSAPTIVSALYWIVQTYTQIGDKIIIQTPVYHRFKGAIEDNNRITLENPLIEKDGKYYMDFDNLEKIIDPSVKMLILCNPHNPVGRVWTKEELTRLGEICSKNNILVVSDEIHCDLIFKGYKHIPFASISEEFAQNSITCIAPTKTFNLAGLQVSNIIIPNKDTRDKFKSTLKINAMGDVNIFGMIGLTSAYTKGEQWYGEMLTYIEENYNYLKTYIEKNIPALKVTEAECTYLAWIDFRELKMTDEELKMFLIKEAKVAFNHGNVFGKNGEGFVRLNFACSKATLQECLSRLSKSINNLGKK